MMQTNDSVATIAEFYNGKGFCGVAKPPISPSADCQAFVKWFAPASMSVLGQVVGLASQAICQYAFNTCK